MKKLLAVSALLAASLSFVQADDRRPGSKAQGRSADARSGVQASSASISEHEVDRLIEGWKKQPKKVAQTMIEKYGPPQEATANRLIWHDNGPWKRTELLNEEIDHDFPKPHKDMLEQVVAFNVPAEKLSDLAAYDGSVMAERTRGELSARCDKEAMNFLALNLAHDIISGKISVEEARSQYTQIAKETMQGKEHRYTSGLQFQPLSLADAGDPDEPTMEEAVAE